MDRKVRVWERIQYLFVGLTLILVLGSFTPCGQAQELVGSVGRFVPESINMLGFKQEPECGVVTVDSGAPGHEIAIGELNAADHEIDDGWFHVGNYISIVVHPKARQGLPQKFLELQRGKDIVLVVREYNRLTPRVRP